MFNFVLIRVACGAVFRAAFAAGTCLGGAGGVLFGLMERSAVGIMGGAFLGLAFGLAVGLAAAAAAAVFNLLTPYMGGIAVRLEPRAEDESAAAGEPAPDPDGAPPAS